mmetsp:Transcript_9453/g.29552  ORF Transcript_9453/g.29552 Transcript_9453/m.29552 type:complete len:237 (+) Transcript_9453:2068-2778(+)
MVEKAGLHHCVEKRAIARLRAASPLRARHCDRRPAAKRARHVIRAIAALDGWCRLLPCALRLMRQHCRDGGRALRLVACGLCNTRRDKGARALPEHAIGRFAEAKGAILLPALLRRRRHLPHDHRRFGRQRRVANVACLEQIGEPPGRQGVLSHRRRALRGERGGHQRHRRAAYSADEEAHRRKDAQRRRRAPDAPQLRDALHGARLLRPGLWAVLGAAGALLQRAQHARGEALPL